MRNLLDDMLSVSSVNVTAVATDAEALKILKAAETPVQVVVCQAPAVGAKHSLVAKIRSSADDIGKLPVICLSPHKGLKDRAAAYGAGASDYVELPVSPVQLADLVHSWAMRKEHRPF